MSQMRIEAVGQVTRSLCVGAYVGHDVGSGRISPLLVDPYQVVRGLPYRPARVRLRVPVLGQLSGDKQAYLAPARRQNACLHHPGDAGVLRRGESLGHAVVPLAETRLIKPSQRPAGVGSQKSPSCSANTSSKVSLMRARASRTDTAAPLASSTRA